MREAAERFLKEAQEAARPAAKLAHKMASDTAHSAKVESLTWKIAALDKLLRDADLRCENGRVVSGTRERLRGQQTALTQTARRNPDKEAGRICEELLVLLLFIKLNAWVLHWNAGGVDAYGSHLAYDKVVDKLDKTIDRLGERYQSYTKRQVSFDRLMAGLQQFTVASTSKKPMDRLLGAMDMALVRASELSRLDLGLSSQYIALKTADRVQALRDTMNFEPPVRANPFKTAPGVSPEGKYCLHIVDEYGRQTGKFCFSKDKAALIIAELDERHRFSPVAPPPARPTKTVRRAPETDKLKKP